MTTTNKQSIAVAPTTAPVQHARISPHARAHLLIGGLLFALALALRLYRLGAQSLWLDEGSTWAEVTRRGWGALLADLWSPTAAYPLYHLLLKGWVGLAGDSEWALRVPSALAGALAVVAVYAVGLQLDRGRTTNDERRMRESAVALPSSIVHRPSSVLAALLFACSPFAIWHAQDAKVYSLVMLVAALLLWAVLRALRRGSGKSWLLWAALAVLALLVHRLLLLPLAALALACACVLPQLRARMLAGGLALLLGGAGVFGLARAVTTNGWQESGHVAAGPLLGLWLTLTHFSLDRADIGGFGGLPLLAWMLPALVLTLWGLALLGRDARRGNSAAIVLLCAFAVPLLLFAAALAWAPIYEARYATVAFPAWMLVLAYPFGDDGRWTMDDGQRNGFLRSSVVVRLSSGVIVLVLLVTNAAVLLQPTHGLFSGAPVKEEWRQAISYLAGQVLPTDPLALHPDDLLVLHPYYAQPLWDYYAPRVTPDSLPQPVVFTDFSQGYCAIEFRGEPAKIRDCFGRKTDGLYLEKAYGKKRALLLIAPEHAATLDRPKTLADLRAEGNTQVTSADPFGWVGLRFQYEQRTWPCGGATFVGVAVLCQSYPSFYGKTGPGSIPQPSIPLAATWGGELRLRGWSQDLPGGAARPGGTLPVTLFWQALTTPRRNYSFFLHLCKDCSLPPLAGTDGPPLNGYPPAGLTTTWQVGDPVHDERALALPADLAPGRYTLLLGVRDADADPADLGTRLPVTSSDGTVLGGTRLVLGEITVGR